MSVLNLSFAACGFAGIYHLGVVGALLRHGDKLLGSMRACAGSSAGALVAAVLITAPDKLEPCKEFTYRFAESVRQQKFGAVTPGFDFMLTLRDGIEEILPREAHSVATDRLHVSITHSKSGKNCVVSRFTSRDELIEALLASSFVPVYAGLKPVEFRGQKWIDGGFSDSLPILPVGRTITVSPFAGLQDVCPVHKGFSNAQFRLPNMTIMLLAVADREDVKMILEPTNLLFSMENLKRLNQSLFPPSTGTMRAICEEGFSDAVRFLERECLMS